MSTPPIRIGVAGARYGLDIAQGFRADPRAEIHALAEPDPARRDAAAQALNLADAHAHSSLEALLQAGELDALVVATPTYLHEQHIGAALDAGLHVLCAAPIGARSSEVSHIVTSAGLVGKTFMYANPLRFDPRLAQARALVEADELGDILHASGSIHIANWDHPADSWRLDRERGGGALLEVGAATLDALWRAMGAPDPIEAMAARYDPFSASFAIGYDHPAEDFLSGMVRFKNGACLQFAAQLRSPFADDAPFREMRLVGARGGLDLERGLRFSQETPGAASPYASAADLPACHAAEATAFLDALDSESPPDADGKQATALHKMIDALLSSAREKEAVPIKVERSLDDLFGGL